MSEMGWTETHRRWQALQDIEARATAGLIDELPWDDDHADVFGSRDALAAALRHRWEQTRRAQLDTHLPEHVLEEQWCRLRTRQAAVLRILRAHEQGVTPAVEVAIAV